MAGDNRFPLRLSLVLAAALDSHARRFPLIGALTPRLIFLLALAALIAAVILVGLGRGGDKGAGPGIATEAGLQDAYSSLPLYFVQNRGQVDPRVAYYVQGSDTTLYFTSEGLTFALIGEEPDAESRSLLADAAETTATRWAVKLDFVGANPGVTPVGQDPSPTVVSYFKGSPDEWKTGIPTYSSIVYPDLWPGIDMVYSGTVNRLKYSFLVAPGADPGQIRLAYRGATSVALNDAGQLQVSTPAGGFHDDKPYSYQEVDGRRLAVPTSYVLEPATSGGTRSYGFRLGPYDTTKPLVLDPAVLVYAGYIGGSVGTSPALGFDAGSGIAVDGAGNAYVTGNTTSSEASFPVAVGPDLTFNGGGQGDAFVAKVNAAGTALVYAGYIGGSSNDFGNGIAVDGAGNAYVTGRTTSSEATFPVAVGPDLTFNGGGAQGGDAFVAKVNAAGTALVYAGYIGGSGDELGNGIAVDGAGNAYVTGSTDSSEASFPVAAGPDLTFNGGADAFVAKVNVAGTALTYAGYIGGSGNELGNGIAVDGAGNAYVIGDASSSEASFPVAGGPDLTFNGGTTDPFVAKVNAAGTALVYAGYIGGSGSFEQGNGIAVDAGGNAYVTGWTDSSEASFPVAGGPDLTHNGGLLDPFVAKVNAAGTALTYAGYIGGSGFDAGNGIAVDAGGNAYVTGSTGSSEASFPVVGGPDLTHNGGQDAFVAKVDAAGTALVFAGYIGGSGNEGGSGIALDGAGNAYVTGATGSSEASFPVAGGPDLTFNGGTSDAFVAKVTDTVLDGDNDTIADSEDNCPDTSNTDQFDNDNDGQPGVQPGPNDNFGGDACDPDDDNDGIADVVDDLPLASSTGFSDGATTSGTVTSGAPEVSDLTDPAGVKISASGGPAAVTGSCSPPVNLTLTVGDVADLTCTSASVEVITGPVEATFGTITATLPSGTAATITETSTGVFEVLADAGNASNIDVGGQTVGAGAQVSVTDTDGDGVVDSVDNCPAVATPWLVPVGDDDCDGTTTALENFVGTDPNDACGADAWPPDTTDNGTVNAGDFGIIVDSWQKSSAEQGYIQRADLSGNGTVNAGDLGPIAETWQLSCT